jgi:hypothetical protein
MMMFAIKITEEKQGGVKQVQNRRKNTKSRG